MYLNDQVAAVLAQSGTKSEKIRQLKRQGMKQADIARALGIPDQFVSNVVRGMRDREQRRMTSSGTHEPASASAAPVRAQVGEAGRIVIPAALRAALGIEVGDTVLLRVEDGELRIVTPLQALRRAQAIVGQLVPEDRSLADELVAERRMEADVE